MLFINFSSAFNCIQPHILAYHLTNIHSIDQDLVCLLVDFLTERSQKVRVNGVLLNVLLSSTGSPQGCVFPPLLFILYTNECQSQHLYSGTRSSLTTNAFKTKGMISLILGRNLRQDLCQAVDIVQQYKYLRTIIENNLIFDANTDVVCAKTHQRMYFYRKNFLFYLLVSVPHFEN